MQQRFALILWLFAPASSPLYGQPIAFEETGGTAGFLAPFHTTNIPAGGIAIADFNRNGYPDIFVTGFNEPSRMFFNQGNGTFTQNPQINTQLAGAQCSATAAADFDDDGWPDLYVGCRAGANHLFRNLDGTGFADVTPPALDHDPLATSGSLVARTDAVAWGDLTGNGFPDLFVGIYPSSSNPDLDNPDNLDRILLNHGDGTWSRPSDLLPAAPRGRAALAAVISDLTGNSRPDLYVINDKLHGNSLWQNGGPGCGGWCFADVGPASGADRPVFGMGVAIGNPSLDGRPQLYISSIDEQILLHRSGTDPLQFEEIQETAGVDHSAVGWATILADFDNDGLEDAFLAVSIPTGETPDARDQLFRNAGGGLFANVTKGSGLDQYLPSHAAAWLDYDRDGRLDLVIGHWNFGYRLYRNVTPAGNWIGFRLEGGAGIPRDPLGTRISVTTPEGTQWRELRAGESRASSHDRILLFGLGSRQQAEVTIHWPGGLTEVPGTLTTNRYHHRVYPPANPIFRDRFAIAPR